MKHKLIPLMLVVMLLIGQIDQACALRPLAAEDRIGQLHGIIQRFSSPGLPAKSDKYYSYGVFVNYDSEVEGGVRRIAFTYKNKKFFAMYPYARSEGHDRPIYESTNDAARKAEPPELIYRYIRIMCMILSPVVSPQPGSIVAGIMQTEKLMRAIGALDQDEQLGSGVELFINVQISGKPGRVQIAIGDYLFTVFPMPNGSMTVDPEDQGSESLLMAKYLEHNCEAGTGATILAMAPKVFGEETRLDAMQMDYWRTLWKELAGGTRARPNDAEPAAEAVQRTRKLQEAI